MPRTIQIPWLSFEHYFQKTAFLGQLGVRPQQVPLSLSSLFDPLCLVIKKYKNPLQNKLCCLQTFDHVLIVDTLALMCRCCVLLLSSLKAFSESLLNSHAVGGFEFQQRLLSICPTLSRWTVLTCCSVNGK